MVVSKDVPGLSKGGGGGGVAPRVQWAIIIVAWAATSVMSSSNKRFKRPCSSGALPDEVPLNRSVPPQSSFGGTL